MEKGRLVFIILVGIIMFHIINNYIISSMDLSPIFTDGSEYIRNSFKIYSLLLQHKFLNIFFILGESPTSLFPILSFPFYLFFGLSQRSAIMTNFIFIIILVFSVYGLGRLLHSRRAGILSALIVMSFPGIFSTSRTYRFDFALVAMISLSVYFLLRTKKFIQIIPSLFLGLSVGLGIIIKPPFVIFFLPLLFYYLFISFSPICNNQFLFKKIKNFLIFLTVCLPIINILYISSRSKEIGYYLHAMSAPAQFKDLSYFSSKNILFFIKGLFGIQTLYFFSILFCIFSISMFFKNNKKDKIFLFLWFLIPYLFFTFYVLNNKQLRFTAPYLPAIALIISISLFEIKNLSIRRILIFLAVFVSFFQFVLISYVPSANLFIDSLNEKIFDLSPFFSAPAYKVDIEGHPHAYNTDYGLNHITENFKGLERVTRKDRLTFVDVAGQITRPIQYLVYKNDPGFKKELIYDDIINRPSQVEIDYRKHTFRFVKPPDVDFVILPSDLDYEFVNLKEFMKLAKIIKLKNNESLYIFENLNQT